MKINKKLLCVCLIVPLAAGGAAALLTGGGMKMFETLSKPPLSPPGWLFPVAWTVLYILMGIASYCAAVFGKAKESVKKALALYGIQLLFNFLWPVFFFGWSMYLFAFIWLAALWLLILATAAYFYRLSKRAGALLVPYLLWTAFAGYLNWGIYLLN